MSGFDWIMFDSVIFFDWVFYVKYRVSLFFVNCFCRLFILFVKEFGVKFFNEWFRVNGLFFGRGRISKDIILLLSCYLVF